MRSIQVSTEVFAGIWSARLPGEDSENAILHRLLSVPDDPQSPVEPDQNGPIGFADNRYGVVFHPGFVIFRTYKGREYRAQAVGGMWVRTDNSKGYMSLNQLSDSIGAKENAWDAWFFTDGDGQRKPIADRRNPDKIQRRSNPVQISDRSAEELGL